MLKKLKQSYERLLKSNEFKHKGFLCGAFILCEIEELDKTDWQIDFYNKETDTITTYLVGKEIQVTDDAKVFKEEETKIEELKLDEIKVSFDDIKKQLQTILDLKNETPVKITIILQKQDIPTWNIIYITKRFNVLNVRISAVDGKILEEKVVPLLSFEKGNKNNIKI